jgi:glutathione S-transferase
LTEGRFLVIGGYQVFINYLKNNNSKVRDRLFPEEYRDGIDKHLNWFMSILRVCTARIIRNKVGPLCFGERKVPMEQEQKESDEFFKRIVPQLNKMLIGSIFFCADEMTAVDILIYNEVATVLKLTGGSIATEHEGLLKWLSRMQDNTDIRGADFKLEQVIDNYKLS